MSVEGKVVGDERDVGLEQDTQATLELLGDRARTRAPEDPMVDEQQVGAPRCGQLEELEVRRDARGDRRDLGATRDLQPVGPVVLEALRLQQRVELVEDLPERRGHGAKIAVWNTPLSPRGV